MTFSRYECFNMLDEYKKDAKAGALPEACIDCGQCEEKCPQHLKIRDELKRVVKVLEEV